ncbi:T9SS type A sorting domain-containing protein, partial [Winogradskyella aurantia]
NDECVDAEPIACGDTVSGSTANATDSGDNASNDVWYELAGTTVGQEITASLCGSSFDTFIRVFDACGGTQVASNDDDFANCGSSASQTTFVSDGTSTYYIMVEGFGSASGDFDLAVTCVDPQPAPANDECVDAEPIACGDAVSGSTAFATDSGENASNDVWYELAGTLAGQEITASLCGSSFDTVIRVFDACGGTEVVSNDDFCGTQSETTFVSDGTSTYYIMVEGFSSSDGDFDLAVSCVDPPACVPPVIDSSTVLDSCNPDGTGTFTVDIVVSDGGDAGSVFDDGTTTYPVVAGTVAVGPYDSGDTVTIELVAADTACSSTVGTFSFTCTVEAPDNDEIAGAIMLPVGDTLCETEVVGTNVGATDSIENDNEASCSTIDPTSDVWFSVTVPATGELNIQTSAADIDSITDTVMEVYSGTSGALVEVACSDDEGPGAFSLVELTGLTPGDVLLVRVWECGVIVEGNFNICAWSPSALDIDDSVFGNFNYYPNPVENTLTLGAQNNIETVVMFNMLGQEVLRTLPNNVTSNLDMSRLDAGAYFVKVTIANITKTIRVIKE